MKTNKVILLGLSAAAALFTGHSAFAQASLTASGYTQNFSSMGTGTTAPTGWSVVSEAGSHYTFSPNVANEYNNGTAAQNENFTAGTLTTVPIQAAQTPSSSAYAGANRWECFACLISS
jgi:hypothetical protein